jgi:predicted 3-demethylubiquinone-9 3-methyltransferase (glyoxalase superfamily)
MQKIISHLWYDKEAKEAAEFYTSIFPDSAITNSTVLHNTPSGDAEMVSFNLMGHDFMAISAGPYFKLNPSISLMVNFDPSRDAEAKSKLDETWNKLSDGGKVLIPLDKYPYSERYGWIQDKYGLTWQLILTNPEGEPRPVIVPSILFVKDSYGKAEEASDFYISVFKNSKRGTISRYPAGMEPNKEGTVMFTDFMLEGQWFSAMDGGGEHDFKFNEAFSFLVNCDSQEELDYYWEKLSAVPESEQCGWLKDKFGVSWQISSTEMHKMLQEGTPEQIDRVTQAFLKMKKFDLAKLREAYESK